MFIELAVTILNAAALFLGRLTGIRGTDLIPAGVIIVAAGDGPLLLWSALLLFPFFILSPTAFSALWVVLPLTLVIGVLVKVGLSAYIALGLYYLISVVAGVLLGHVGPRYGTFLLVNAVVNTLVVWLAAVAGVF